MTNRTFMTVEEVAAELDVSKSVSYTHLDVYKRQEQGVFAAY